MPNNNQGIYQGPKNLARGNFGERTATWWLSAHGYQILFYKPEISGTNQPGIDIVAMRDRIVYFIDNKALTRAGNVASVSALTTNFTANYNAMLRLFTQYTNDVSRSVAERVLYRDAINAMLCGNVVLAVTNANFTPDSQILKGVTAALASKNIKFIDVMS